VFVLQADELVTLGGCHLLDNLVVVSVEAHKEIVRCSGEELCEGHCAHPTGATKSNSSKARRKDNKWSSQVKC
jgi:hypothetical protein